MRWLIPKSLRGQLVLMILATFVVVQGFSLWLFIDERRLAVRAALEQEAGGRAANLVRLLEAAPQELHPEILRSADSPLVRFAMASSASVDHADHDDNGSVILQIQRLLDENNAREIRAELHRVGPPQAISEIPPEMRQMHANMMGTDLASVELLISIALQDGNWLNVSTRFHRPPIQWPWVSVFSFGLATLIIMSIVWIALSRLTGPLRKLADSAESLGRGETVPELSEQGPEELRLLTMAFNNMQARLTRFVSERTRMLAALGHDLRSPLTAMRVRSEMVEDTETRERLIAIIAEMQEMVDSTLSFARGMVTSEESRSVDMYEFLDELIADLVAVGGAVKLDAQPGMNVRIKPVAMRRAIRNVIENAIRYGQQADVKAEIAENVVRIVISDIGEGIPEADLERVFDPFVRIEKSRSLETGGTGLGLSIARTVIHAHGGEIKLSNNPQGGLKVEVVIPVYTELQGVGQI
ncbi:two-component sensor histidine kinase [Rhodobacterales bacterium 52_120_T64]|nr:two-component sensor histidine kinase [Rhodobacterales bacterium 52_120_T64]